MKTTGQLITNMRRITNNARLSAAMLAVLLAAGQLTAQTTQDAPHTQPVQNSETTVTVPDGGKLIVGGHFHPEYEQGDPRRATTQPVPDGGTLIIGGNRFAVQPDGTLKLVKPGQEGNAGPQSLRNIRVAVFDFDVLKGVEMEPAALTDQVNTMLAAMDKVTIVNRDQIKKVADEHKMALSGLVDTASAAQLGKFLSANYVIVGRASKIGQTNYLVLKMIDVGTTVQTTVSAKAVAEKGLEALIERLAGELGPRVRELQKPIVTPEDETLAKVRAAAKVAGFVGKTILVEVSETHIDRPLVDPAAQMAVANRLNAVGVEVIVPKDPPADWKKSLLETGKYGDKKVDFLLEGEGTSAYAAEMQGMISCRARVELRLIAVPGRSVTVTDRGVAARVDLVEALAAKAALEDAGANALDAVILQQAKTKQAQPQEGR